MSSSNGLASEHDLFGKRLVRRYKVIELPVSGHRVRIQSITERELSSYQTATIASGGTGLRKSRLEDANRRFIVMCLVDDAGNRILNTSHIAKLADWDAADMSFLHNECASHCGINREDIEELVKNSEEITVVSSPTDSPGTSPEP